MKQMAIIPVFTVTFQQTCYEPNADLIFYEHFEAQNMYGIIIQCTSQSFCDLIFTEDKTLLDTAAEGLQEDQSATEGTTQEGKAILFKN